LFGNNREKEMGNPVDINSLFFPLKGSSPRTEIVFLNQNLAIRRASIVRDFHADLLGAVPHRLFDFVDEPAISSVAGQIQRECARRCRGALVRASRARTFIEQILNGVSRVLR
jgi:hypothetical protein